MYKKTFKPQLLAASIATILATSTYAQDQSPVQEEDFAEVIEVKGIRGSLMRSMDLKRESMGVVDGISAEDIGKFPDTNLAESLQRITGVAIERDRGEGSKITVRGFGPDFNIVTFNSRQMPTSGGRSFDFGNIASEGISAVEVYKSGRASVPTGGIGAVVNVKTTKPLAIGGRKAVFSGKGVHDPGTRDGSSFTPEFASLLSDTFADDTFGVSLSMSYQEREGGSQSATTQDFISSDFYTQEDIDNDDIDTGWGAIAVGDPSATNFPSEVNDGIYAFPTNIQYNLDDFNRKRLNGQLTLQWRPIESLTATMDYTYAENQIDTQHQDLSAWFDPGCSTRESEWVQEGNIWSPTSYTQVGCAADNLQGVGLFATVNENKSLGFNLAWTASESLSFSLDYHDSSGESGPNSKHGSSGSMAVAALNRITTTGYFTPNGMPILEVQLGERNSYNQISRIDQIDVNDMQLSGSGFGSFNNRMDVDQIQFEGKYEFEAGHSIDFGIASVEVTNRGQSTSVQRNSWSGVGTPGDIADLLRVETIDGVFDGIEGSGDPRQVTEFFTWNFEDMIERGEQLLRDGSHGDVSGDGGPCLTGFCPSYNFDLDEVTTEKSNSIYIQTHFIADFQDMTANLFVGLRYEETEVHSEALVPLYDRVEWSIIDNRFNLFFQKDADDNTITGFSEIDGSYDMLLPSVDFDIEVLEDVIFRASYSLTITRPVYNDLKGALIIDYLGSDGGGGRRGNPQLLPMESSNIDLSLEWYYGDASYASIGYWTKDVENFINSRTFEEQPLFTDLNTPFEGNLYNKAVEAITGGDPQFDFDNADVNAYFVENFADEPNVEIVGEGEDAEATIIGLGADPVALFDVTIPVNERSTKVKGWEMVVQHTFDSGFGFQANYTIVDGDLEYDINLNEEQWVVPGMSDTANLVAFYEKDGLQARIAYNWREKYLQSAAQSPRFIEEYFQWDFNVSYEINDNLAVFVEGINLTEEDQRIHGRSSYQVRQYSVGHARYNIGARYVF
ncbi:TonB-dependent receptor [uncultured Paraglaciecola sp.]|jgi:TonB-dependent receptor|uniref:TonB-dependent receptor n=1 Tax=uncultured Paraglaciecola sp. TaxID=1765024 RepID=UPI00261A8FAD|nr:TonB-dependent receptor [uncultured Paraglaciecola sp.]